MIYRISLIKLHELVVQNVRARGYRARIGGWSTHAYCRCGWNMGWESESFKTEEEAVALFNGDHLRYIDEGTGLMKIPLIARMKIEPLPSSRINWYRDPELKAG